MAKKRDSRDGQRILIDQAAESASSDLPAFLARPKGAPVYLSALLLSCMSCATQVVVEPNKAVVMSADLYRHELSRFCSRPGPPDYESTWSPSAETIADIESRFGKLQRLKASRCCLLGARVRDVNAYTRQYFGIVVDGRRLIYINATEERDPRGSPPTGGVADFCDGGESCWGAHFDPESKRFFDLAFNGVA